MAKKAKRAKRVRAKNPRLRLDLVVLAPRETHHGIIQAFDTEFADSDVMDERFLPDVQLVLKPWNSERDADLVGLEDSIDIALAPALFGTQTSLKALAQAMQMYQQDFFFMNNARSSVAEIQRRGG